jgi:uncharacterized protein (DUF433 family)
VEDLLIRITSEADKCGGRQCVRSLRIRVSDVLELLAVMDRDQILQEHSDLEDKDLSACLLYASRELNHANLTA